MTHRLMTMEPADALYDVARAYPGGIDALAEEMGTSAGLLYKKLAPKTGTHAPTLDQFDEVIGNCIAAGVPGAHLPLQALAFRHGLVSFVAPAIDGMTADTISTQACAAMKEFGEVIAAMNSALCGDSRINAAELDTFERELHECFAALGQLRTLVHAKAKADQGA
jgi:hypothetical protein